MPCLDMLSTLVPSNYGLILEVIFSEGHVLSRLTSHKMFDISVYFSAID